MLPVLPSQLVPPVVPVAHWGDEQILGYDYETVDGGRVKEHRKVSLFPRKTVKVKVGKPLDIASLIDDPSPEAKHTRTELGVVTDAMLDAVTELLEDIRGEKAPTGRWNPRTKRREAPGEMTGIAGNLGEPDPKIGGKVMALFTNSADNSETGST